MARLDVRLVGAHGLATCVACGRTWSALRDGEHVEELAELDCRRCGASLELETQSLHPIVAVTIGQEPREGGEEPTDG